MMLELYNVKFVEVILLFEFLILLSIEIKFCVIIIE